MLQNVGTSTIYIGGSDVTTANGINLEPGSTLEWGVGSSVEWAERASLLDFYGIVGSGTQTVKVLERST